MVKKEQLYKMANLERRAEGKHLCRTVWIPEQFAIPGKYLKIKEPDGSWRDHWQVVGGCGGEGRNGEYLIGRQQAHKKTREASDI